MKKIITWCLILLLLLSACGNETPVLDNADFSFPMPEGYTLTDVKQISCTITRDSDGLDVGGMEVVPLTRRALTERGSKHILEYLQGTFFGTNNVEYIASRYDGDHPIVSISMRVHWETQLQYTHYFFDKEGLVYHLWLDMDVLGDSDPGDFLSSVSP